MNDELSRCASAISDACYSLQPLFGQGYGSNLDRLIEQLEKTNTKPPLRPIEFAYRKHTPGDYSATPPIPAKYETLTLTGLFHQFALEGDGQDIGPIAIIETPDGQIYTPAATKCRFLDHSTSESSVKTSDKT